MSNTNDISISTGIEHIVISGGGPSLFSLFGALKRTAEKGVWDPSKIKSVYGCSSGSWLGAAIALLKHGLSFDELESYITKRPWETLFATQTLDMKTAFSKCGIFDDNSVKETIVPLLKACDFSPDVSLREFCETCDVNFVCLSSDINQRPIERIVMTKDTFGDLPFYSVISRSMALPGLIVPFFQDDRCLIDGGLLTNYPFEVCQTNEQAEVKSILGFKIKWTQGELKAQPDINFIEYLLHLVKMMALHIEHTECQTFDEGQTVNCEAPDLGGPSGWIDGLTSKEVRDSFVLSGIASADKFLETYAQPTIEAAAETEVAVDDLGTVTEGSVDELN
jgi:predicted acylesterase/phospholipase RssA